MGVKFETGFYVDLKEYKEKSVSCRIFKTIQMGKELVDYATGDIVDTSGMELCRIRPILFV